MLAAAEPRGLALVSSFLRTGPSPVSVHAALAAAAGAAAVGRGALTTSLIAHCEEVSEAVSANLPKAR